MTIPLKYVLACVIAIPALGGWQRHLGGDKGASVDSPGPHPLAYFKRDPCLRPETDRLFYSFECTYAGAPPPSKAEFERRANTKTELTEVGMIDRFEIHDLWYTTGKDHEEGPDLRSVLVKTGADSYQEIDVRWREAGEPLDPSVIVKMDGQPVLIVTTYDMGHPRIVLTDLYIFRQNAPELLDFKDVDDAVTRLLPPHMALKTFGDDFETMQRTFLLYRDDLNLPTALNGSGTITVTYRLVDGRIVVIESKYVP